MHQLEFPATARIHARLAPGALIALAHVLIVLAFLRHGDTRRDVDTEPADYIAFAFIPATLQPKPDARTAPPSVVVPRKRVRRIVEQSEPAAAMAATGMQALDKPTPAMAVATGKLDMESLRSAARTVDSARPRAERAAGAAQLRGQDDTPFAHAVQEAKRPDCQKKYSGGEKLNLILLIPLAIETITDKGCQW